jgi:hypothetical protein
VWIALPQGAQDLGDIVVHQPQMIPAPGGPATRWQQKKSCRVTENGAKGDNNVRQVRRKGGLPACTVSRSSESIAGFSDRRYGSLGGYCLPR